MSSWIVIIEVCPYFPAGENQVKVGDKLQYFNIPADDFNDASNRAIALQMGIQSNPAVWLTNILGVYSIDLKLERVS